MTQVQTKPRNAKREAASAKKTAKNDDHPLATAAGQPTPYKSKLDHLAALLAREDGCSLAEMMDATSWQAHSVRGALAGALKIKRGLVIVSVKVDGARRYSLAKADA